MRRPFFFFFFFTLSFASPFLSPPLSLSFCGGNWWSCESYELRAYIRTTLLPPQIYWAIEILSRGKRAWGDHLAVTKSGWRKGRGLPRKTRSSWPTSKSTAMEVGELSLLKPVNNICLAVVYVGPHISVCSRLNSTYFLYICRSAAVWEELQAEVDQLPEARHQEGQVQLARRANHHSTPCPTWQQVNALILRKWLFPSKDLRGWLAENYSVEVWYQWFPRNQWNGFRVVYIGVWLSVLFWCPSFYENFSVKLLLRLDNKRSVFPFNIFSQYGQSYNEGICVCDCF